MFLIKIKEIKLFSGDLNSVELFYSQLIGLPIIFHDESKISFRTGDSILTFLASNGEENPYYHFAFNITETKKDQCIDWLKSKGITINLIDGQEDFFSESWHSHSIYFYDPSGNVVEFIARHRLSSQDHGEFGVSDILSISEIGFAVTDVLQASTEIESKYGQNIYQSGNELFAPMGDEEGLLIVSSVNRNWLGSNKPVRIFPCEVTLLSHKESEGQLLSYPYTIREIRE